MKIKSIILSMAAFAMAGTTHATIVFSEDFGVLDNGTTITTSNTDLTYVRIGTQGGGIEALNPSTVGTGASALITGPTGGSLNGIGVGSELDFDSAPTITMAFDFKITDASGTVVWGLGSGSSFTGNAGFNTSQGLGWFQASGTDLQRREGGDWISMTDLSVNTAYAFFVSFNVADNTMSVTLDTDEIAENVPVTTPGVDPDGIRIYSVNGSNIEVDNIELTAIPEPATALLGGLGLLALLRRRR